MNALRLWIGLLSLTITSCLTPSNPYPQLFDKNQPAVSTPTPYRIVDCEVKFSYPPDYAEQIDRVPYGTVPKDTDTDDGDCNVTWSCP